MSAARTSRRRSTFNPIAHGLVWFYAFLLVVPLYFLLISSFKDNTAIFNAPFMPPTHLSFSNFIEAWQRAELGSGLVNSAYVTIGAELLTLVLAVPTAYALARSGARFGAAIERVFALGLLIPAFAALVPTLLLAIAVHLFHTREFLIFFMSATALPLSVILLTQFMRAVPKELVESAQLDGAGRLRILRSVFLPVTLPGIATVLILNFLSFWNEYLFSLVLAGPDPNVHTVQVALPNLVSKTSTEYGILLAGCLLSMIPVYAVYMVLQRRVEDALLQGAVKG